MNWPTLYPVMVLTCRRGIFHRTLKAVQFKVSSWMSNGGLSRSEAIRAEKKEVKANLTKQIQDCNPHRVAVFILECVSTLQVQEVECLGLNTQQVELIVGLRVVLLRAEW